MKTTTLTTLDGSLLVGVREALGRSDEALLCVAFVSEPGVHLLGRELRRLRGRARLLVTTQFGTTRPSALGMARDMGVRVRQLNPPGGRTYHPKLYVGRSGGRGGGRISAVVGSANMTQGLVSNIEVACLLEGRGSDAALRSAWDWAETMWAHPRAREWEARVAEPEPAWEDGELLALIEREVARDPMFLTLGGKPAKNLVTDVTPGGLFVETARSRAQRAGSQLVPFWMIALAWEYLRAHGTLSNSHLLNVLHVHRSSFVCALLARLPGVRRRKGRGIVLEWVRDPRV